MAQMLSIFLQASGILFILWITVGWLVLGGERGGVCVRMCHEGQATRAERFARSCLWLRESGLVRMRIALVDCGLAPREREQLERFAANRDGLVLCQRQALMELLEKEAKDIGKSGSAPGNSYRDHISEP